MLFEYISFYLVCFAIVILCLRKKIKKISMRWLRVIFFCAAISSLLLGTTLYAGIHLIPFASPEQAYKCFYGNEIDVVIKGTKGDYVIHDEDVRYINKSNKGWTIPITKIELSRGMTQVGTTTIYVTQYNFSEDYYVLITDFSENFLELEDNRESIFYKLDSDFGCAYAICVSDMDKDYTISVNGEEVKVCGEFTVFEEAAAMYKERFDYYMSLFKIK